jgi:general secretion pathway protein D
MTVFGWPLKRSTATARRLLIGGALVAWTFAGASLAVAQNPNPTRLPPLDFAAARPEPVGPPVAIVEETDLSAKLRERGDLVLTDTTLRQALFTISESWRINLVVGEDVSGQVNGVFKNAPLHEILHSILFANGYGYRIVGQGLVVMKLDTLGDNNPLFVTDAIPLRALKPEDVIEGANLLRSPQGKLTAIPSARTLMVVDLPERVAAIRSFVQQIDESTAGANGAPGVGLERRVAQFVPQFVKVLTLKESLDAILSKDGKAVTIEAENRLVIVDYVPNLQMAAKMIRDLDVPRPQVRITALIYDVSLEDLERLGINWNHAVKGNAQTPAGTPEALWAVDSLTHVPASAGTTAATMTFMNLSRNFDIRATIEALCQSKDAQLLADPSVTVVDRQDATIQIVTEIPYQQLTQTQQGGNIGTTAFREAGVTLKVTPHISSLDNTVQMEVTPTFSRLTGFTNGGNPQPIIDKRQANTTVRVMNQQWLVIGGLRQRTAVKDDRAIPKLSNIKYLGKLFQAYDYSFRESELVVFLMPEVVQPDYRGREREQNVLASSSGWLDETPISPAVLGHGEVGCPSCGNVGCNVCGKHPHRWYAQTRNDYMGSLGPSQSQPVVVNDQPATPNPNIAPPMRRLPQVESTPTPVRLPPPSTVAPQPSTARTPAPAAARKPEAKRTMLSTTWLKPSTKVADTKKDKNTPDKVTSSRKTAQQSKPSEIAKTPAKPEAKKTASTNWMTSWWK